MKKARSARGEMVDFDLLAIKQQLATKPVPVGVDQRRRFIDEKDGIKTREVAQISPPVADALSLAIQSVQTSAQAISDLEAAAAALVAGKVEIPAE